MAYTCPKETGGKPCGKPLVADNPNNPKFFDCPSWLGGCGTSWVASVILGTYGETAPELVVAEEPEIDVLELLRSVTDFSGLV